MNLENWAEEVWSETRRLARLSGSEDTASTRPRLGRGAITWPPLELDTVTPEAASSCRSAACRGTEISLVVSR